MNSFIAKFKKDDGFLTRYLNGMSNLHLSGIFEFLKEKAQPRIIGLGADSNVMAVQAARSAGYFEALDDLYNFKEKYLTEAPNLNDKQPDYGGDAIAIESGDLNKEELDAIRTGTKPKYSAVNISYINPGAAR